MAKAAPEGRDLPRALRRLTSTLENDLRQRSGGVDRFRKASRREYERARLTGRTAATYAAWRDERVTQIAAAWVLGAVYVRFCEDNGLVDLPFLAGPGNRLAVAEQRHEEFLRRHPGDSDRDWLIAAFERLARSHRTLEEIFSRTHNPLWQLSPSFEAATELVNFWRQKNADGRIRFDFTDADLDTDFLGDVYEDLSDQARRTHGLLRTPDFIVEFILDLTLQPALAEFGLEPTIQFPRTDGFSEPMRGLRCIDPACGSGSFLIGMFRRLLNAWRTREPKAPDQVLVQRALDSVHGCDRVPFAVNIARFRLLITALREMGRQRLEHIPDFRPTVAVADSLSYSRVATATDTLFTEGVEEFTDSFEEVHEFFASGDLLAKGSYHVVVTNPPFIIEKDMEVQYRRRSAPPVSTAIQPLSSYFLRRAFDLAVQASNPQSRSGFIGILMPSSFTRREFGRSLIEDFLRTVDLTHVIDSSGAYIPGYGTPTVILIGRQRTPAPRGNVRAVLGIQREPFAPAEPARGLVWQSLVEHVDQPGAESVWLSVRDVERSTFATFPWNLAGGGESELQAALERSARRLGDVLDQPIGAASSPGPDGAFILGAAWFRMHPDAAQLRRRLVAGHDVRDWSVGDDAAALVPYAADNSPLPFEPESSWGRLLWPLRQALKAGAGFGGSGPSRSGRPWWSWARWVASRHPAAPTLTYAAVATHNHVALEHGETAFLQSAPVIVLPDRSTSMDHLALLGVLNSSTVCFWLKQVSPDKGTGPVTGSIRQGDWSKRYHFTGRTLQRCPLPDELPSELGRSLHALAQQVSRNEPKNLYTAEDFPTLATRDSSRAVHARLREQMIALQEELDWSTYGSYGLLGPDEVARTTQGPDARVPEVRLGERAFEIVLARAVAAGEADHAWFKQHGAAPVTEIPARWPSKYRAIVQARMDAIATHRDIALIERPEYKRRWSSKSWEHKEQEAIRSWLLDRCSDQRHWFREDKNRRPRILTIDQLADLLHRDDRLRAIASRYATDWLDEPDAPLSRVLADVIAAEHVPYLAVLRYRESGLRKRAQWEQIWDLQRKEDDTGQPLGIPIPPKYTGIDYLRPSYWRLRGNLDVARERFISYPDAGPADSADSLLLGWGGWNHLDQAEALADLVKTHIQPSLRLTPLLAGLRELMPWVHQWYSGAAATHLQHFLDEQSAHLGLSADDLAAWRPAKRARGRI
ncbi:BREX-2 system adenine-specific DNA-methyltransferase PglX [Embleya hyalina]|uniref:site-specific DNA-methyltransferase (adenine-specific) n=1 Tax=Embleya hyalina TaxID=516124 RepID=A0A401YWK2_9ACTN|nr:BREX-2 system adenine-specific DNA-methyltransferase PglX [Embleya hyalina]GCD98966.1 DNA methylase [Embleya hyalina]